MSIPPMGWNSWDCFGTTVTEDEVLANAAVLARDLRPHGWDTVVVDIQWYEPTARAGGYNARAPLRLDDHGRPMPVPARFPSAAGGRGFGPLADRIHRLGLRFGLHVMRGIPRLAVDRDLPILGTPYTAGQVADPGSVCDWNDDNVGLNHDHPGARAYYDSLAALFAGWGVDFVKADDMLGPYHEREISALAAALRGSGRDILLSLSPGRRLSTVHAGHLGANAGLWRVSDDLWDRWPDVYHQFGRAARWAPLATPGHWADLDMLPLGRIGTRAELGPDRDSRLTPDEQRTMLTLWCIARSPLMFGGDLTRTGPDTLDLLTNDAVLAVLRSGSGAREVLRENDLVVWTADAAGGGRYVALFNLNDDPLAVRLPLSSTGSPAATRATDLWTGSPFPLTGGDLAAGLAPHAARLLRLDR